MDGSASIVLVAGSNLDRVRLCLESVRETTRGLGCQLVVVNNARQEPVRQFFVQDAQAHPDVVLIHNRIWEKKARCLNTGAAACRGEFLVFLDSDVQVMQGWLPDLLRAVADPANGMAGPRMSRAENESRVQAGYPGPEALDALAREQRMRYAGQFFEIEKLSFSCLAMRREIFDRVGRLDEGYALEMFAEADYAARVRRQGLRLVCAQEVVVQRREPEQENGPAWPWLAGPNQAQGPEYPWDIFRQDRQKFEEKWGERWTPPAQRGELLDEQLDRLVCEVMDRDLAARQQRELIRDLERKVRALETERDGIYSGTGWKILQGLLAARAALAPPGTFRQRVFSSLENSLDGLLRAGKAAASGLGARQASRAGQRQKGHLQHKLAAILAEHVSAPQVVLFLPTIHWDVPLFQRPHQLALALARLGCLVFFAEKLDRTQPGGGFRQIADRLYVASVPEGTFEKAPSPAAFTLAYNRVFLSQLDRPRVIYEYIDELEVFPFDQEILRRNHDELARDADLVIATSDRLYREIQEIQGDSANGEALLLPNGVDDSFIWQAVQEVSQPPEELAEIVQAGRPIIGYYGALAHWFDFDLLVGAAADRPGYQFLLIGPEFDDSVRASRIGEGLDNLLWLGPKPYAILPRYLRYFDVATIPFKLNPITHATSPLKLYEYMSAGKPCVTTAMHECMKYPEVLIARDRDEFTSKLDEALRLKNDPAYLERIRQVARANTWEKRAGSILAALASLAGPGDRAVREGQRPA